MHFVNQLPQQIGLVTSVKWVEIEEEINFFTSNPSVGRSGQYGRQWLFNDLKH